MGIQHQRARDERGTFVRVERAFEHQCRICERTDPRLFTPSKRTICRECLVTKNRDRAKNRRGSLGTIYFAQIRNADAFVKIGHTCNVAERIPDGFFTDNPYPIDFLATPSGYRWEEFEIHRLLTKAGCHVRGEWYKPEALVLDLASDAKKAERSIDEVVLAPLRRRLEWGS